MPPVRPVSVTSVALELEGTIVGIVKSFGGVGIGADVIRILEGSTSFARKSLVGAVQYDALTFQAGLVLDSAFFDWIAASWSQGPQSREGAFVAVDPTGKVRQRYEFGGALITEVGFPALDGASKEPGALTVTLAVESVIAAPGEGSVTLPAKRQKGWVTSNFRVELDGLDTKRIVKVDAWKVTQKVTQLQDGQGRHLVPTGPVEFPDLTLSIPEVDAKSWMDWFDDFVLQGNHQDEHEKEGAFVLLAPDMQAELARIDLHNVGIHHLHRGASTAADAPVARLTAGLYCEQMALTVKAAETAPARGTRVAASPRRAGASVATRRATAVHVGRQAAPRPGRRRSR